MQASVPEFEPTGAAMAVQRHEVAGRSVTSDLLTSRLLVYNWGSTAVFAAQQPGCGRDCVEGLRL
jgi:hypothetical protein